MIIIGITGTLGAGKGAVVEYLVREKGFAHYSVREFINDEVRRRGLPVNRDSQTCVGTALRREHSPSYIVEQLYRRAEIVGGNAIIESVRALGEVDFLKARGDFLLLAVDADPSIRYERIASRGSEKDAVSFEKFLADEGREMSSLDPDEQNISACLARADYTLRNDGTLEELYAQVDNALEDRSLL